MIAREHERGLAVRGALIGKVRLAGQKGAGRIGISGHDGIDESRISHEVSLSCHQNGTEIDAEMGDCWGSSTKKVVDRRRLYQK